MEPLCFNYILFKLLPVAEDGELLLHVGCADTGVDDVIRWQLAMQSHATWLFLQGRGN